MLDDCEISDSDSCWHAMPPVWLNNQRNGQLAHTHFEWSIPSITSFKIVQRWIHDYSNLGGVRKPTDYLTKFFLKLHENEKKIA